MKILRYLFEKKTIKGRWIYLLAAVPFFLFALTGIAYGAFLLYFLPALLCVIQFIRPTIFLWATILGMFTCGSVAYLFETGKELLGIIAGERAKIFLNAADSSVFTLLLVVLISISVALIRWKPELRIK